jgi:hypothetical protein
VSWWRRGALATAQEAADGLRAGAAKLLAVAAVEGQEAIAEFTTRLIQARRLLPDPSLLRDVVEASR